MSGKLIIYQNEEQKFIMTSEQEDEFVCRMWEGIFPDSDEWERLEISGPIEIERPTIAEIHDVFEVYDI